MTELDNAIRTHMLAAIEGQVFPGGVVGYIRGDTTQVLPFGHLTYQDHAPVVTPATLYDIASITKSIPTASVILALVEQGRLSLDDPVITYIPELAMAGREQIQIRHLLNFTAVFDLTRRLSSYAHAGKAAVLEQIFTTPLKYPPGEQYLYANIPSLLLGIVAERVLGKPLDATADDMFFKPLHMRDTTFHPSTSTQVAPTEIDARGEVAGEVHDETAWALSRGGQVPGHAGLFSTAGDLLTFSRMLLHGGELDGRRYFEPSTINLMQTEAAHGDTLGSSLGWTTRASFISSELPAGTFGKEGFTGTFLLLNPNIQRSLVLLTNRTYPKRPDNSVAINDVRRTLANLVLA